MKVRLALGVIVELCAAICFGVGIDKVWTLTRGAYYAQEGTGPDPLPWLVGAAVLHLTGLAILFARRAGRVADGQPR